MLKFVLCALLATALPVHAATGPATSAAKGQAEEVIYRLSLMQVPNDGSAPVPRGINVAAGKQAQVKFTDVTSGEVWLLRLRPTPKDKTIEVSGTLRFGASRELVQKFSFQVLNTGTIDAISANGTRLLLRFSLQPVRPDVPQPD
jgi:hypothetical protein